MCKTSSFFCHTRHLKVKNKNSPPPSCCSICSQQQWLTSTNNSPYCLLYIELCVFHGVSVFPVYCQCVFVCQGFYRFLTTFQSLHRRNVMFLLSQPNLTTYLEWNQQPPDVGFSRSATRYSARVCAKIMSFPFQFPNCSLLIRGYKDVNSQKVQLSYWRQESNSIAQFL